MDFSLDGAPCRVPPARLAQVAEANPSPEGLRAEELPPGVTFS